MDADSDLEDPNEKKSRNRSPNYPLLDLEDAVKRVGELHRAYGKHQFPVGAAHKTWGYKEHGGVGNQCVAAIKAYGLIEVEGAGKARKLKLTDRADRIVRNAPDRPSLLKKAAQEPTIHAELLAEYRDKGIPPDDLLKNYLVWERNGGRFNEDVVDSFIERFRATLGFSGLDIDDENRSEGQVDSTHNGKDPEAPNKVLVGSFVQWTSQGVEQFSEPQQVVGVKGDWAFVEGSQTGIPMSDLAVVDPPTINPASASNPPANPFYKSAKGVIDPPDESGVTVSYKLDEGVVRLQWPDALSQESVEEFEYWVQGLINRAKRKAGLTD